MTNRDQAVFEAGWKHGAEHGEASARKAETVRPDLDWQEVARFCNGSADGALGDTWRMNLGRSMVAA